MRTRAGRRRRGRGGYPDGVTGCKSSRRARRRAAPPLRGRDSLGGMQDSSDDDAAPEEPSLESSASPSIRMSLNMGSLTSSGSNLFKEEDAAIKGGEVTLNFTDEAAGKEFRLNVRRQMPPRVHPDPHSPRACRLAPSHRSSPWVRQSSLSRPRSRTSGNGSMSGPTRQWRCVCLAARDPRLSGPAPYLKCDTCATGCRAGLRRHGYDGPDVPKRRGGN